MAGNISPDQGRNRAQDQGGCMRFGRSVFAKFVGASLLASPLFLLPCGASAQQTAPDAENCTRPTWGYLRSIDDEYGTVNICSYAVDVWFMAKSGQSKRDTIAGGGTFRTGLKYPAFDRKKGWIATTCRAGYSPSVDVSSANWEAVLNSQYNCKKP